MQSQAPTGPSRDTGLPPGVEVGPLGARLVAYLIDASVPVVCGFAFGLLAPALSGGARVALTAVLALAVFAWALLLMIMIGGRAASPGMRAMKMQLVGFYDGRPVGLVRAFLRGLVFWALSVTGIGLVIMLILLVVHPRHQGWHDRLAEAVVIKARSLPPPVSSSSGGQPAAMSAGPSQQQPPDQQQAPPQYAPQQPAPPQPAPPQQAYRPQPLYPPSPQTQQPPSAQPLPPQYAGQSYAPVQQPAPQQPPIHPPVAPTYPANEAGEGRATEEAPGSDDTASTSATTIQAAATGSGWTAVLDDGRTIEIDGLVLLGRNPQPQPGEEDAQLIKLADETRTVSKSHLAIGLDAAGIYIVDRGSTNGSTVTDPAGVSSRCQVSEPIYVGDGTIVSMGDHWLRIEYASA